MRAVKPAQPQPTASEPLQPPARPCSRRGASRPALADLARRDPAAAPVPGVEDQGAAGVAGQDVVGSVVVEVAGGETATLGTLLAGVGAIGSSWAGQAPQDHRRIGTGTGIAGFRAETMFSCPL